MAEGVVRCRSGTFIKPRPSLLGHYKRSSSAQVQSNIHCHCDNLARVQFLCVHCVAPNADANSNLELNAGRVNLVKVITTPAGG